jgi:hypothetical protein
MRRRPHFAGYVRLSSRMYRRTGAPTDADVPLPPGVPRLGPLAREPFALGVDVQRHIDVGRASRLVTGERRDEGRGGSAQHTTVGAGVGQAAEAASMRGHEGGEAARAKRARAPAAPGGARRHQAGGADGGAKPARRAGRGGAGSCPGDGASADRSRCWGQRRHTRGWRDDVHREGNATGRGTRSGHPMRATRAPGPARTSLGDFPLDRLRALVARQRAAPTPAERATLSIASSSTASIAGRTPRHMPSWTNCTARRSGPAKRGRVPRRYRGDARSAAAAGWHARASAS